MASQARSTATRQRLIAAAVELFAEHGLAEPALKDVAARARVTSGALAYHFPSKQALVAAILEQGWSKTWRLVSERLAAPGGGLENVITMTFFLAELMQRDETVWLSSQTEWTAVQLGDCGRLIARQQATRFIDAVTESIAPDIREGTNARTVAEMIWMLVAGSASGAGAGQFARGWRTLLGGVLAPDSVGYFSRFLERSATPYPGGSATADPRGAAGPPR